MTLCDLAYNCETNYTNITSPVPLCAGWNVYGVYEETTLGVLRNQTNSTYVYYWNQTGQNWDSVSTTTGSDFTPSLGSAVWIYSNKSTSWYRGASKLTYNYTYNFSSGHNYVAVSPDASSKTFEGRYLTFGNITTRLFRYENGTNESKGGAGEIIELDLKHFASWNNSGKSWASTFEGYNWSNETKIGKEWNNDFEVIWSYSGLDNISWNGTHMGCNWTESANLNTNCT